MKVESHLAGLGPTAIAVLWVQTFLAFVFICLRLYTRIKIIRSTGWDDHLATISLFLFVMYSIFCTTAANYGLGSHSADLSHDQFIKSNTYEIIGQTFNIIAIATSKSSVAFFLLRIVVTKWHTWFLYFCIFSLAVVCITCALLDFFQTTPLKAVFDPSIPHTVNFDFTRNAIFSGSYCAGMDFILAIFPWLFLWNLQMKRKERLTIAFGLSLGVFAGVFGIVRAIELQGINARSDYSFATVPLILWGSSELLCTMLCATIPVLRPLYTRLRGGASSGYSGGYKQGIEGGDSALHHSKNNKSFQLSTVGGNNVFGGASAVGAQTTAEYAKGPTNTSDESILGSYKNGLGNDFDSALSGPRLGVKQTTDVTVSYAAR